VELIDDVSIELNSENITLNADFRKLEKLTNLTNVFIQQNTKSIVDQSDYVYRLEKREYNNNTILLNTTIGELLTQTIDGTMLLNTTLGDIYSLEKEETATIASDFFRKLDKVNEVLSTINGAVGAIDTVLSGINTLLSGTQSTALASIAKSTATMATLMGDLVDGGLRKSVLEVIAETEFVVNAETLQAAELLMDACEYDPLGIGPINCNGLEGVQFEIEGVNLIP